MDNIQLFNEILKELNFKTIDSLEDIKKNNKLENMYNHMINVLNINSKQGINGIYLDYIVIYETCMRIKSNPNHFKFSWWLTLRNQYLNAYRSTINEKK